MARRRRGFTFIEMIVVITIMALMASIAIPSMAGAERARQYRSALSNLKRLPIQAREAAISRGTTVVLHTEGNGTGIVAVEESADGVEGQTIGRADLPEGLSFRTLRVGDRDAGTSDWSLRFYSDGTSDGGGFEIEENANIWSVVIEPRTGRVQNVKGEMPPLSEQSWPAGEREQKLG